MKIVLNAVAFVPGRMGGVESYLRNLVSSLQELDGGHDYYLICNQRDLASFQLSSPRFHALRCAFAKPSPLWYLRAAMRELTPLDPLRLFMDGLRMDLVHHPFSVLQPIRHRLPSVLTFHDMQHEYFPEYFSRRALQARKALWRPSAEQATRIVAISGYAKSTLVERYQIDPDKIDVVYNGYDRRFAVIDDHARLAAVKSRYNLDRPFIYYPAASWPHKNHMNLLAALRLMVERFGFDGRLVLSGIAMQGHDRVLAGIDRLGLRDNVKLLGYLPQEDLPSLYNLARVMAFPSRHEGFGIPLLEAMACGCPVACSNVTSIPEVAGSAALTFDPDSVEEIAEALWTLWSDETLRADLAARGLERVKEFSWGNMARQTVQVYERIRA